MLSHVDVWTFLPFTPPQGLGSPNPSATLRTFQPFGYKAGSRTDSCRCLYTSAVDLQKPSHKNKTTKKDTNKVVVSTARPDSVYSMSASYLGQSVVVTQPSNCCKLPETGPQFIVPNFHWLGRGSSSGRTAE